MQRMFRTIIRSTLVVLISCVGTTALVAQASSPHTASIAAAAESGKFPRVFEEPLLADGQASRAQTKLMLNALHAYREQSDPADLGRFEVLLKAWPDLPWRVSLQTNLGLTYYHYGYFSRAISAWEDAWRRGKSLRQPEQRAVVDRAVGELIRMYARIGRADRVEALLKELEKRPVNGSATEMVAGAREGLWVMRNEPGISYLCGPMALRSILATGTTSSGPSSSVVTQARPGALSVLDAYRSKPNGVSLNEVDALARQTGLDLVVAYRDGAQDIPLPAVVHWKVNHYAAIVDEKDGRYHLKDPTFGTDLWISRDALDSESSGYFMIPSEVARKPGWRAVAMEEGKRVRGMGYPSSGDSDAYTPDDDKECDPCNPGKGMAHANVHSMLVSLNIQDTPVGTNPPYGPKPKVTFTYNQRESLQPTSPRYSNVGPKWTFNWLSYIQDDPTLAGAKVKRYVAGGGGLNYSGYNSSTGMFAAERRQRATLVKTANNPVRYERRLPDGGVEIYAQSDGSTAYPRKVLLSQVKDPVGNTLTLNYDWQTRLVSLKDATGGKTSFVYDNPGNPLLITQVIDAAGRKAKLDYDARGRLVRIVDPAGMASEFTYAAGDFIDSMTTPYGTSRFAYGESGVGRWLELTDPSGATERVEYRRQTAEIPSSDAKVPVGMRLANSRLDARNTFYWDKEAHAQHRGDYTKARIKHWLYGQNNANITSGVLESIKYPLESRIWFNYPGQSGFNNNGVSEKPSLKGRVLSDGTTQIERYVYNSAGSLIQYTDPRGRELHLEYAANQIDLLKIKRRTSTGFVTLGSYTWNELHRPTSYIDAAGNMTRWSYNRRGQLASVINPLGERYNYIYHGNGHLWRIVNPYHRAQGFFEFDNAGRLAKHTDSQGMEVAYFYDDLDRLTRIDYPQSARSETFQWSRLDLAGWQRRDGRHTTYTYDNLGRRLSEVMSGVSSGGTGNDQIQYGYDRAGRLTSLTDGNGNVTTWQRDIQGRVIAKTYADGKVEKYGYETATSRLFDVTDELGQRRIYTYHQDNLLRSKGYFRPKFPTPNVVFGYDEYFPRLTSMYDGIGTTYYGYAAKPSGGLGQDNLVSEDGPFTNDTIAYTYDRLGRVTKRSIGTQVETFAYDKLGRRVSHSSPLGDASYSYLGDSGQQLQQTWSGSPLTSLRQYLPNEQMRQLEKLTHIGSGWRDEQGFANDAAERIVSITRTSDAGSDQAITETHDYDHRDRLLRTQMHGQGSIGYDFRYTRDAADNIVEQQLTTSGPQSTPVNVVNQIDKPGYRYDANGSLLSDGDREYTWDAENRLVQVKNLTSGASGKLEPGQITRFRYDGLSRLAVVTETPPSLSTDPETRYLWCGSSLCQARNSRDMLLTAYFEDGQILEGRAEYYVKDSLGSVIGRSTGSGPLQRLHYTPYGGNRSTPDDPQPSPANSNGTLARGFAQLHWHQASGLYLALYRAYDPESGRWLSRDPIGERGGINLYAYVEGNPISLHDAKGLAAEGAAVGASVGAVAGGAVGTIAGGLGGSVIPGFGTVGGGLAGATEGALWGAAGGAAVGSLIQDAYNWCTEDDESETDRNCEALYQSSLQTCAGLSGRKKFSCFEAARENREQCYRERGR
ncbi:RHS repeat-associated core domain-containing protein [Pseudomonas citronellolis]|uniref:RHS repeat-associated core domain-containing protein n=1 Tax=Pseudomonas citronellolis TaxID=53408 RepID=UPI00209CD65B|nr:RHS repeat-associated core domain-containing protein [Pseudomonas citronellolis]MCP1604738.1 RHS repeat-associated protein [Pseudomonas citronellolis]MCP1654904.1 RHS repeat-associated protein [Pseudomonas citronellolis]MCP1722483.1 RHS repeat-associated protein [Pseudomonas citronellolis]